MCARRGRLIGMRESERCTAIRRPFCPPLHSIGSAQSLGVHRRAKSNLHHETPRSFGWLDRAYALHLDLLTRPAMMNHSFAWRPLLAYPPSLRIASGKFIHPAKKRKQMAGFDSVAVLVIWRTSRFTSCARRKRNVHFSVVSLDTGCLVERAKSDAELPGSLLCSFSFHRTLGRISRLNGSTFDPLCIQLSNVRFATEQ